MSELQIRQLEVMFSLQEKLNNGSFKGNWRTENVPYYRAAYIETVEFICHLGFKWWKKEETDNDAANMELVDIAHFLFSEALVSSVPPSFVESLYQYSKSSFVPLSTKEDLIICSEHMMVNLLEGNSREIFSSFFRILLSRGLDLQWLFLNYVGKNTLNHFRQDKGYREGTYIKEWYPGKEDNDYLTSKINNMSLESLSDPADLGDQIYIFLSKEYEKVLEAKKGKSIISRAIKFVTGLIKR